MFFSCHQPVFGLETGTGPGRDRDRSGQRIVLGNISSQDTGIALEASFDSRDNVFTPNSGQSVQATVWRYAEALGGDYSYWKGTFKALSYHQLVPNVVIGLRLEASAVDGRPPFYGYPWVVMRGIPAMRYQSKRVGMLEVEGRWNILPRWAAIGFFGKGLVSDDDAAFETRDNILAGGAGVRYLFMPKEGLWLGVDAARGPESWYTYCHRRQCLVMVQHGAVSAARPVSQKARRLALGRRTRPGQSYIALQKMAREV